MTRRARGRVVAEAFNLGLQCLGCSLALVAILSACAPAEYPSPTSDAQLTSEAVLVSPTSQPSGQIRPAAVAGSWYPGDPDQLSEDVERMLDASRPVYDPPLGIIVPHAGYAYSGPIAAAGFRQLRDGEYEVAVIIASDHQEPISDPVSVWVEGGFETPLGVVPVADAIAQALVEADPRITQDPAAHRGEHPIEIELPFLQRVCPNCRIVPILMGDDSEETVDTLADALLSVLPDEGVVVVASSDLSHYPCYDDARAVDGATLGAIETFDPARVRKTLEQLSAGDVPNLATCACGKGAILTAMRVVRGLGADTATVLGYSNSGDVTGDHSQVVGYGAVMLWAYEPPELTSEQRAALLTLARATLEAYLEEGSIPDYDTDDVALTRRSGLFVTLKQHGELRGCVGRTWGDITLCEAVQKMAVQAATEDQRFTPLTLGELDEVEIEISVLSPLRRVTDVEGIHVGTHGLMIYKDGRRGLLLPQVPVDQGWDRETYLDRLCQKAGLPGGCWVEGATLYAFTALVFGEQ